MGAMPLIWRQLVPQDQVAHRYYGMRGGLLALYIATLAMFAYGAYDIVAGFSEEVIGATTPTPAQIGFAMALKLVRTALLLPFLIMAPLGHRQTPAITISCLWGSVAISMLGLAAVPPPLVGAAPVALAVLAAIMTWYLITSERVNVTYRRRTRDA
jgi:hypothetical protein